MDENIPLIRDLQRYYTRVLPTSVTVPSFEEIVECERSLMHFFKWDLMVVTPTLILKLLLANGIFFDNEDVPAHLQIEVVHKLYSRVSILLEAMVKDLNHFRDKNPSLFSAAIVYAARKDEFSKLQTPVQIWTQELEMMTGYGESELQETADRISRLSSYSSKYQTNESSSHKNKEN